MTRTWGAAETSVRWFEAYARSDTSCQQQRHLGVHQGSRWGDLNTAVHTDLTPGAGHARRRHHDVQRGHCAGAQLPGGVQQPGAPPPQAPRLFWRSRSYLCCASGRSHVITALTSCLVTLACGFRCQESFGGTSVVGYPSTQLCAAVMFPCHSIGVRDCSYAVAGQCSARGEPCGRGHQLLHDVHPAAVPRTAGRRRARPQPTGAGL